jgi:hypothetical protein
MIPTSTAFIEGAMTIAINPVNCVYNKTSFE